MVFMILETRPTLAFTHCKRNQIQWLPPFQKTCQTLAFVHCESNLISMVFAILETTSNISFCSLRKQPNFNGFCHFGNKSNIGFRSLWKQLKFNGFCHFRNKSNIGTLANARIIRKISFIDCVNMKSRIMILVKVWYELINLIKTFEWERVYIYLL
jgi:hypothetical protein